MNNILTIEDETGKKVVVLPQIIFGGKRTMQWKEVENYLIQYVGKMVEVQETKDVVYIGRDFADEYTNSIYTKKLKGGLVKAKANLAQGIVEIIEIANGKRWSEDYEKKHKKKAQKGWYRYNSRFALPIVNEKGAIERYNIYQVVLIVRFAADEKLYLYDIQNIKKETCKPL